MKAESEQSRLEEGSKADDHRGTAAASPAHAPAQAPAAAPPRQTLVLTRDESLQAALGELGAHGFGISMTSTVAELSDELMHARTPVALIDAAALGVSAEEFVAGLAKQFPDIVLIVAGNSADQAALARQIASSQVFRFLHKPVSTQRVQIFLESALRHHQQVAAGAPKPAGRAAGNTVTLPILSDAAITAPRRAAAAGPLRPARWGPRNLALAGIAVALVAGAGYWIASRPAPQPKAVAPTNPAPVVTQDGAPGAAVPAGAGTGTTAAVPAEDPQRTLDALLGRAETALIEQRYDDAAQLIESARPLAADSARLKFLAAQLARERERATVDESRRVATGAREQRVRELLTGAKRRMNEGALLEPARDSARAQVEAALALAPDSTDARQLRAELAEATLAAAEKQLDAGQIDAARRLLDAAGSLGAASGNDSQLARQRRRADELQVAQVQRTAAATTPAATSTNSAPPAVLETAPTTAATSAGGRGATLSASQLKLVRGAPVDYPKAAERAGVTGWVDVEFTVTAEGTVRDVEVTAAEPRGYFETEVVSTVRRWRYTPVERDGVPVAQRARLRLRFGLK